MADLIVPHFAVGSGDEITIGGVVYKVPRVDSAGRLSVTVASTDDLRTALASVATDRLLVTAFATGASEVKAARKQTVSPATTRVTVATPAAGKKIRMISALISNINAGTNRVEVYFGTGADITTNPGQEIADAATGIGATSVVYLVWPDGGGPVGAADAVVSLRVSADITTNGFVIIHYREE